MLRGTWHSAGTAASVVRRLVRLLSSAHTPRVSEKRGPYAQLEDFDLSMFERLLGTSAVLTDPNDVEPYNEDWLRTCKGSSQLVLLPRSTEEVSAVLSHCHARRLAVCPQGGNTGLVGGSVPVFDEIVLSTSRMRELSALDSLSGTLVCQAGCVLESLEEWASQEGLTLPLDLGAKGSCQIGGNVATNAGGLRLLRYGSLHDNVLGLEVVLADGTVLDSLRTLRKDNAGYDLKQLFIGSEGTLGLVTQVALQCAPRPKALGVAFLGCRQFEDVLATFRAARAALPEFLSSFELMDLESVRCVWENMGLRSPIGEHAFYILVELAGSDESNLEGSLLKFVEEAMKQQWVSDGTIAQSATHMKELWQIREMVAESLRLDGYVYKYDISVPLCSYMKAVELVRERVGDGATRVCGFGHMGDSNLHLNVTSPTYSAAVLARIEPFIYEWTAQQKGSISAEHGIGLLKKKFLHLNKSAAAVQLMRSIKQCLDPRGILNPYKVIPEEL
uniref:D-2-hydroxyglutarate dehydrogenase, mitochondrial n=1 Tax=Ixodes ricinus TaxID=34613 RepID=A0A131Y155_IXORI